MIEARRCRAVVLAGKAQALLAGRFAVTLDDLQGMLPPALRHRVLINFRGQAEHISSDEVTRRVLHAVPPPQSPLEPDGA